MRSRSGKSVDISQDSSTDVSYPGNRLSTSLLRHWPDTALCAQSNNGILIESPELATIYLDYWHRLKADDSAQGPDFRSENNQAHSVKVDDGATDITLWFSPNTKQKNKPSKDPATP